LKKSDLIIIGGPQPRKNSSELLFTPAELKAIKNFLKKGTAILILTGVKADFSLSKDVGGLSILEKFTGITHYMRGSLYLPKTEAQNFIQKNTNLLLKDWSKHPIFKNFTTTDAILFGSSSYFLLEKKDPPEILLKSPKHTWYYSQHDNYRSNVNQVPVCILKRHEPGVVLSISSQDFFTDDLEKGFSAQSNTKFVQNLIRWLVKKHE
jgi:hypothetical protein